LRRVLLARSCAMGGEDVVGEFKGVDEVGVRFACRGARSGGDRMNYSKQYIWRCILINTKVKYQNNQ